MPEADDGLIDELVAGVVEWIPIAGNILAVPAKHLSKKIREECARNSSKALRAAERASGFSREDLADHISENPRLIPLVIRVLYTAGMTGQDAILRALGTALGDAGRDPVKIDEAELLLIGMANLRAHHIAILEVPADHYGSLVVFPVVDHGRADHHRRDRQRGRRQNPGVLVRPGCGRDIRSTVRDVLSYAKGDPFRDVLAQAKENPNRCGCLRQPARRIGRYLRPYDPARNITTSARTRRQSHWDYAVTNVLTSVQLMIATAPHTPGTCTGRLRR